MRQSLENLLQNVIVFEYQLPNQPNGMQIPKTIITTNNDNCFRVVGSNIDIANMIYN